MVAVIQKALAGPLGWFPGAVTARETGAEEQQSNQLFAGHSGISIHAGSRCLGQHSSQLFLSTSRTIAGTGDGTSPSQRFQEPCLVPASRICTREEQGRRTGQSNKRCMLGLRDPAWSRTWGPRWPPAPPPQQKGEKSLFCLNLIMRQLHYKISCWDEQHSLNNAHIAMTTISFGT